MSTVKTKGEPKFNTDEEAINHQIKVVQGREFWWVADQIGIPNYQFTRMKQGHARFPDEAVGPLAEIIGVSPDWVREKFGIAEEIEEHN